MSDLGEDLSLRSTGTLALWLGCLAIGVAGLVYPHNALLPSISIQRVKAMQPNTSIEVVPMQPQPTEKQSLPAAREETVTPPKTVAENVPPTPQMATLSPASPFLKPLKIERPATPATAPSVAHPQIAVSPRTPAATDKATASATPHQQHVAVQQLVYGQGEGRQPPPIYPRESQMGHQEGTVIVRFNTDSNGSVTDAAAVTRCPWPLLNQAAVRAVKDSWHFASGEARTYEVAIRFQLANH